MSRREGPRRTPLRIVWEYRVRAERAAAFETHYRSNGTWARFFRRGRGYRGTVLLRDREDPARYLTIDLWDDHERYRVFAAANAEEYGRIDRMCGELTEEERCLGSFETLPALSIAKPRRIPVRASPGSSPARGAARRSAPSRRRRRS